MSSNHYTRRQPPERHPQQGWGGRSGGRGHPTRQASQGLVTRRSANALSTQRPPSRRGIETVPDDETASVQPPSRPAQAAAATTTTTQTARNTARRNHHRISENDEVAYQPMRPDRNQESARRNQESSARPLHDTTTNDNRGYTKGANTHRANRMRQQQRESVDEAPPLYQPPQQRQGPTPADRAMPRYSSYMVSGANLLKNPYAVAPSESLSPLKASRKDFACNTEAVDEILYETASSAWDGPSSHGVEPTAAAPTTTGGEQLSAPHRGRSIPSYGRSARQSTGHQTAISEDVYDDEFLEDFDFALFELSELCAASGRLELNGQHTEQDYIEHDLSWNPVREWLQGHSQEHIFPYLQARDEYGKAALHFACQHQPPMDIMEYIMHVILNSANPALLEAQDAFGWTPLHYACAFAAPQAVLQSLAEYRDAAKLLMTNKGLTPIHLALIGPIRDAPDIIAILGSNGAAQVADQQGLLPVHYGAAFGASEESLRVLIDVYPEGLEARDNFGRNPLHFALANTKTNPKAAPVTVRLLLRLRPSLVNPSPEDDGPNPFLFLLEYATQINVRHPGTELRDSIQKCLNLLLDADPHPTPTVFTALRSLPYWLFPTAILSRTVQDLLNEKIKGRFPTMILILDFYVQIMVLTFYQIGVVDSLKTLHEEAVAEQQGRVLQIFESKSISVKLYIWPLGVGATYFLLREFVQIFSLIYLKSFRTFLRVWILHLTDWLDLSYIGLVYAWAAIMGMGLVTNVENFATGAAVSAAVLWAKLFIYLRSASFDFSVFVSGVFYVAGRLVPYMVGLTFFFTAFTQIFFTLFYRDEVYGCPKEGDAPGMEFEELCDGTYENFKPFCDRWSSFLRVYTMFIGEVDNSDFEDSIYGNLFFSFFMFLMVILLANVLIAIVTDSYKVIQDREATLVFYTNRLYFLAETDAIGNVPCFNFFQPNEGRDMDKTLGQAWSALLFTFELGPQETIGSAQFWKFRFVPLVVSCVIIPFWVFAGVLTCGAVWPPQLREWLFTVNDRRDFTIAQKLQEEQSFRRQEESLVETQVVQARDDFYHSLAENRQQLSQIKAAIAERKQEIRKEMKRIKIIMGNLLEQAEQSDDDYYDDD